MRIQHPRATDAYARDAPSQYAVRVSGSRYTTVAIDDEGYMSIKPSKADDVMDGLEANYDVEYDRETGDVVLEDAVDADVDADDEETDAVQDDSEPEAESDDGDTGDDLEAWANWNREDWLSLGWEARKDDVEEGLVDDHLEDVIAAESNQSKRVKSAAEDRLEELED